METIVVVGGSKSAAMHLEGMMATQVLYHDAHVSKQGQRKLEGMIKKADRIVVMVDGCSHRSMWDARTIAKAHGKPIHYNRGLGMSGLVNTFS